MHKCCHLTLNSSKCKYLIASRKRQPHLPPRGLLLGDCILEQVQSYRYLGVLVTPTLTWKDHIQQVSKPGNLLGCYIGNSPLAWADTSTLRCLYFTCIRPHLEYASQLWDPYTSQGIESLESVQNLPAKYV